MLLLEDATGAKFKHISYDGTSQRMTALLAKNIEIGEINLAAAKKHIQTNELKGLGITTEVRNPEAPNVMTAKEQGINLVYGTDRGIVLPKGASADVVDHYAKMLEGAMNNPAVKDSLTKKGHVVVLRAGRQVPGLFREDLHPLGEDCQDGRRLQAQGLILRWQGGLHRGPG